VFRDLHRSASVGDSSDAPAERNQGRPVFHRLSTASRSRRDVRSVVSVAAESTQDRPRHFEWQTPVSAAQRPVAIGIKNQTRDPEYAAWKCWFDFTTSIDAARIDTYARE
jgi:hypothetical protein